MDRITEIEIAGKKYPLNFSIKAAKQITAKFGSVSGVGAVFKDKSIEEMMDSVTWLLALLIEQGVKYKKIIEGEDVPGISADELDIILGVADLTGLQSQLLAAMTAGMNREIETEGDSKNGKATQGQ